MFGRPMMKRRLKVLPPTLTRKQNQRSIVFLLLIANAAAFIHDAVKKTAVPIESIKKSEHYPIALNSLIPLFLYFKMVCESQMPYSGFRFSMLYIKEGPCLTAAHSFQQDSEHLSKRKKRKLKQSEKDSNFYATQINKSNQNETSKDKFSNTIAVDDTVMETLTCEHDSVSTAPPMIKTSLIRVSQKNTKLISYSGVSDSKMNSVSLNENINIAQGYPSSNNMFHKTSVSSSLLGKK